MAYFLGLIEYGLRKQEGINTCLHLPGDSGKKLNRTEIKDQTILTEGEL